MGLVLDCLDLCPQLLLEGGIRGQVDKDEGENGASYVDVGKKNLIKCL